MMDEHEQAELKAILEETATEEPDTEPQKSTRKGKASGSVKVELHYVQENILNFAKRHPDMTYSVKSVFQDNDLSDENLQRILLTGKDPEFIDTFAGLLPQKALVGYTDDNGLPPELNHFIRWLLKIPYAERTEWQR